MHLENEACAYSALEGNLVRAPAPEHMHLCTCTAINNSLLTLTIYLVTVVEKTDGECPAARKFTKDECAALDGTRNTAQGFVYSWKGDGGVACGCYLYPGDGEIYYNKGETAACDGTETLPHVRLCKGHDDGKSLM